jgi:hypothetical protein
VPLDEISSPSVTHFKQFFRSALPPISPKSPLLSHGRTQPLSQPNNLSTTGSSIPPAPKDLKKPKSPQAESTPQSSTPAQWKHDWCPVYSSLEKPSTSQAILAASIFSGPGPLQSPPAKRSDDQDYCAAGDFAGFKAVGGTGAFIGGFSTKPFRTSANPSWGSSACSNSFSGPENKSISAPAIVATK